MAELRREIEKKLDVGDTKPYRRIKKKFRVSDNCIKKNMYNPPLSLCKPKSFTMKIVSKWEAFAKVLLLAFTETEVLTLSMIHPPSPRYLLLGKDMTICL